MSLQISIKNIEKEKLNRLLPELFTLEHNWTEIGEKPWSQENFSIDLTGKWELSIYALYNNKIIGYIIGSISKNTARLNKILVDKSMRGNGIATQLWNEFLKRCKEKVNKIEFKALVDNTAAVTFYKKNKCLFYGIEKGDDGKLRHLIKYVFQTKRTRHSKPTIDIEDVSSVVKALHEGYIATGNLVDEFISAVSKYIGKKYGVTANSGSSALHLALRALDVKEGDEVILPSYICGSVLNPIQYCKAVPVLADINEEDYNISFESAKKKISNKTKAIIVPHMWGNPVKDIEKFIELGIPIIEDCAQTIGAEINKRKVGSFGDVSIFSFY